MLKARAARRIAAGADGLCRVCRYGQEERRPPTDSDRAFWLARFDDETLAEWGQLFFGYGDAAAVAAWRARLGQ